MSRADTPSEACVRLLEQANPKDAEIRKLRREVRRLSGWMRKWLNAVASFEDGDAAIVGEDQIKCALRGEQPPRRKR